MAVKQYLKTEFKLPLLSLDHENASDFYVTCFQKNRDPYILLLLRCGLFLTSLSIFLSSMVLTSMTIGFGLWWVFFTHWSFVFIPVTCGLAFLVSLQAYRRGPLSAKLYQGRPPWYIKAYWISYNVSVPTAYFITLFYVFEIGKDYTTGTTPYTINHAMNFILVLTLMITCRQPSRILHFYYPLVSGIVYVVFSGILYTTGFILPHEPGSKYSILDWSRPELVSATAFTYGVIIIIIHLLVVGVSALRDFLTKSCREDNTTLSASINRH